MDFALLSKYDDLLTDIFLDDLFLWFTTVKMNSDHRRPRIPSGKVLDIIQRNVLIKGKLNDAVSEFLSMDYFKGYLANKTPKQQQEFVQHMKRYLSMYLPNAGYEISETKRYSTLKRAEACVLATKDWMVGDELRLCTGAIACLNAKEDAELKQGQRDFSVMYSTRKGCSCLFLGPARFFNHDCDSNCKFIASGQNGITFKLTKNVACGEELTTYYGKHYFGDNNCECRCVTCERLGQGAFAIEKTDNPLETTESESQIRRSGRKRKSVLYEEYDVHSPKRSRAPSTPPSPGEMSDVLSDLSEDSDIDIPKEQKVVPQGDNVKLESLSPSASPSSPNKPLVMSIGFLCAEDVKGAAQTLSVEHKSATTHTSGHQRVGSGSPLDLLCDAIMDAEFLHAQNARVASAGVTTKTEEQAQNAILHNDQPGNPEGQHVDMQDIDTFEDSLFDDVLSDFDEFDDGISDLSSIDSDLLSDVSDAETPPSSVSSNERPSMSRETSSQKMLYPRRRGSKQELRCLACDKPLFQKESADPADPVVTELATWTWSPSAVFIDWCPKRCPRCERHFAIFKQEWPKRKFKVKKDRPTVIVTATTPVDEVEPKELVMEEEVILPLAPVPKTPTFSRRNRLQKPVVHTGMLDTISALREVFGESDF
ncbi:histone lysine methyltransferase Set9 [Umbelopsis sp. WA50703]